MGRIRSSKLPKALRRKQTDAEAKLWYFLRSRNLEGFKFRRQHRIGLYIVDIVCLEKKLVVELDGSQHHNLKNKEKDNQRSAWLKNEGYRVMRVLDNEVLTNTEGVLEIIRQEILR